MKTALYRAPASRPFALALLAAAAMAVAAVTAAEGADSCLSCHGRLGGRLGPPAREFPLSVHREAGITCVTCHGGNAALPGEESMSPKYGFRGKPSFRRIPEFCAGCHSSIVMMRQYNLRTDQYAEYRTSVHGRLLYGRNDTNVAVCTSCHGAHEIRRKTDPLSPVFRANVPPTCGKCHADAAKMRPYGIPTDQVEEFGKGIHGQILSGKIPGKNPGLAPNCATCHGVHGATPPGIREVANVCGGCHASVVGYFRESAHFAALQEGDGPKCVTCHGNHTNRMPSLRIFSGTGPGECGSCHEPDSKALEFAKNTRDILGGVEAGIEEIRRAQVEVERSGRSADRLKEAQEAAHYKLIEVGPVIHAFSLERVFPLVHEAEEAIRRGRQEIRNVQEEQRQRKAVAGYAVTMLLLIAALLSAKIALLPKTPPAEEAKKD